MFVFFIGEECVGSTFGIGSASSTHTMDVVLNLHWEIVIDNYIDILDIDSSTGNICSKKNLCPSRFETVEDIFSGLL